MPMAIHTLGTHYNGITGGRVFVGTPGGEVQCGSLGLTFCSKIVVSEGTSRASPQYLAAYTS